VDDADGRPGLLSDALATTLAATLTTMPLILYYFGRLSLVTILANALVLPVQPSVIVWGGLATLGGLLARPVGQVVGWVAWVFLTFTIEAVSLMARVPFASIPLQVPGSAVAIYYALLGSLTLWFAQTPDRRSELRSRLASRPWPKVAIGTGVVLLALAVAWWRSRPDELLHVAFLDVGQGDAIFVQTPGGRQVLIDGGPSESALLDELGRQMPFWDRSLDVVVLTHADMDHITGLLAVLERYHVGQVVYRDVEADSAEYKRWLALVAAGDAGVYSGETGLKLDLEPNVRLSVLHPGAHLDDSGGFGYNNASVVLRLTYGTVSVLLPGDIEARVEGDLVASGTPLASTVLKAAHHGSCTSTTEAFLSAVAPDVVVISVGENDFGHPCEDVLERLHALGQRRGEDLPVYRTDEVGTVEAITDGVQVWVRTER
jgi:competence protein ComEC